MMSRLTISDQQTLLFTTPPRTPSAERGPAHPGALGASAPLVDLPAHLGRLPRTINLVVEEARPRVLGIFALRFLGGALISGGLVTDARFVRGCTSWVLLVIAIYVLNGYADIDGDRVNGSTRPIASGRLGRPAAAAAIAICALLSLAVAASVSGNFFAHASAALILGAGYSLGSAPTKANPITSAVTVICGGLLTYHAGMIASGGQVTATYLCFSLALSFWMVVGGLVKDLPDVSGDAATGRRTVAVTHGEATTVLLAALVAVLVATALVIASVHIDGLRWPALVVVVGMATMVAEAVRWHRAHTSENARTRPYKAFMITQYGAHVGVI